MPNFISRFSQQLRGVNPFDGDSKPSKVKIFFSKAKRPSLPFPHPWNYSRPIDILETFFCEAGQEEGAAKNNRYIQFPGFAPVLVTRDPGVIKSILLATSDKPGDFDRDTLPSTGIARATGKDTLLYANGPLWRMQRKLAAPPFGKSSLFQPEKFQEFEITFRQTIRKRLDALELYFQQSGESTYRVQLESEVKVVMLEMLSNNFFGAEIPYEDIRDRYAPALERVISHIVSDTVINQTGIPVSKMPSYSSRIAKLKSDYQDFEKLTDLALAARKEAKGLWSQFKSDAPDENLRSNIRVFLAGALEATTSFASWALDHLARNPEIQERVFQEVQNVETYTPENLKECRQLTHVLEETLRLTPSLYFLPRKATADTWIETDDQRTMMIPQGTHILLDVWHANRLEEFWGVENTGYPASEFAPGRWETLSQKGYNPKNFLHYGFGHGPRVCPGKFLGQLEVGLVVGAIVKKFQLKAVNPQNPVRAGVSTKPEDGVLVDLRLR